MAKILDVSFEMDEFSQNKLYEDAYALAQQLYLLLLMRPGDCPDDLDKGIDMMKYRVDFAEEVASLLQSEIIKQAADYCDFSVDDVFVTLVNSELRLVIQSPSFSELIVYQSAGDSVLVSLQSS